MLSIQSYGTITKFNLLLTSSPNPSKVGNFITISGKLTTESGTPIPQTVIHIQYSRDLLNWTRLGEKETDESGSFYLEWLPSFKAKVYLQARVGRSVAQIEHVIADYIVTADGTGDFISIQDAVNTIPLNDSVIYIKEGNYYVTKTLNLEEKSNIVLIGSGYNTKIIKKQGITFKIANVSNLVLDGFRFHHLNDEMYNTIRVEGKNDGIVIRNCWFTREAVPLNGIPVDVIYFDPTSLTKNLLIKSCYIKNAQVDAIAIKKVINGVIESNIIIDAAEHFEDYAAGVTVDMSSNITISKNHFSRTGNQTMIAINVFGSSENVTILENEILNVKRGINVNNATNIRIERNQIIDPYSIGVRVENTSKISIIHNYFETISNTNANAIVIAATTRYVTVAENIIKKTYGGIIVLGADEVVISKNEIDNAAYTLLADGWGILLDNCTNVIIENNSITRAYYFGLAVHRSPGTIIRDNIVLNSMLSGVRLWSSNNSLIFRNIIKNNGCYELLSYDRNGIDLVDSFNCTIYENSVLDDQVTKTQRYGLVEKGKSDYNLITRNDFRYNKIGAIQIVGPHTIVVDNLT
jgi:parallel beta-helix repeat protein